MKTKIVSSFSRLIIVQFVLQIWGPNIYSKATESTIYKVLSKRASYVAKQCLRVI